MNYGKTTKLEVKNQKIYLKPEMSQLKKKNEISRLDFITNVRYKCLPQ